MKKKYYIPENLDLKSLLIQRGHPRLAKPKHLDLFYYIIDHIYIERVIRKLSKRKYVRLNHEILQSVLTTRFAGIVKKLLIELDIIEENSAKYGKVNYLPNVQSKEFRFTEKYRSSKFTAIDITNLKIIKRVDRHTLKTADKCVGQNEALALIRKSVESLSLDFDAAEKYLTTQSYDTQPKKHVREYILQEFKHHCLSFKLEKTGRFNHIFVRCPRDLRPFCTFKGQPLYEIDVTDCQPALHATLYPTESSEEKTKFCDIISQGQFKAFINSKLEKPYDLSNVSQKQRFKKELFHRVFYGSRYTDKKSDVFDVFRREFPELSALIAAHKKYNNRDLPVHMQKMEADTVIADVSAKLAAVYKNDPDFCLISIHDCLVTTEKNAEIVKQAMMDGFRKRLGFDLGFKLKRLTAQEIIKPLRGDFSTSCLVTHAECLPLAV